MKCTDCQGTGLENDNKVCPNCDGFGKIGEDEVEVPAKFEKIVKEKVVVKKPIKIKK